VDAATRELVDAIRACLAGRKDVRLALLFGSRARGVHRPDSDVDIAVVAPGLDPAELAAELSSALGFEVDVVPLVDPGVPLLERLIDEAHVVHEGERGAAASWRTAALLTLETDRPWYRRMRDAFLARVARSGV
jgi:predicted nucleotidyltransferase